MLTADACVAQGALAKIALGRRETRGRIEAGLRLTEVSGELAELTVEGVCAQASVAAVVQVLAGSAVAAW